MRIISYNVSSVFPGIGNYFPKNSWTPTLMGITLASGVLALVGICVYGRLAGRVQIGVPQPQPASPPKQPVIKLASERGDTTLDLDQVPQVGGFEQTYFSLFNKGIFQTLRPYLSSTFGPVFSRFNEPQLIDVLKSREVHEASETSVHHPMIQVFVEAVKEVDALTFREIFEFLPSFILKMNPYFFLGKLKEYENPEVFPEDSIKLQLKFAQKMKDDGDAVLAGKIAADAADRMKSRLEKDLQPHDLETILQLNVTLSSIDPELAAGVLELALGKLSKLDREIPSIFHPKSQVDPKKRQDLVRQKIEELKKTSMAEGVLNLKAIEFFNFFQASPSLLETVEEVQRLNGEPSEVLKLSLLQKLKKSIRIVGNVDDVVKLVEDNASDLSNVLSAQFAGGLQNLPLAPFLSGLSIQDFSFASGLVLSLVALTAHASDAKKAEAILQKVHVNFQQCQDPNIRPFLMLWLVSFKSLIGLKEEAKEQLQKDILPMARTLNNDSLVLTFQSMLVGQLIDWELKEEARAIIKRDLLLNLKNIKALGPVPYLLALPFYLQYLKKLELRDLLQEVKEKELKPLLNDIPNNDRLLVSSLIGLLIGCGMEEEAAQVLTSQPAWKKTLTLKDLLKRAGRDALSNEDGINFTKYMFDKFLPLCCKFSSKIKCRLLLELDSNLCTLFPVIGLQIAEELRKEGVVEDAWRILGGALNGWIRSNEKQAHQAVLSLFSGLCQLDPKRFEALLDAEIQRCYQLESHYLGMRRSLPKVSRDFAENLALLLGVLSKHDDKAAESHIKKLTVDQRFKPFQGLFYARLAEYSTSKDLVSLERRFHYLQSSKLAELIPALVKVFEKCEAKEVRENLRKQLEQVVKV